MKAGGPVRTNKIHRLCSVIWQEEEWLEEWTKSVLVDIPKKRDLTDCAHYSTIALITHLSKIIPLIILERLKAALGGFQKDKHCTTDTHTQTDR